MTATIAASDFPVPADLTGYWEWDALSTPWPYTPLTLDLFCSAVEDGFSRGMDAFASPNRFGYRAINGYAYAAILPRDLGGESLDERSRRHDETLARELPRLAERWDNEWLPGMLPGLERARTLDYAVLPDERLLETLDELWDDLRDRYTVHGQFNFIFVAASRFADFYAETLCPDDLTEPYQALQGFPNMTVEAGRRLWQLSRSVRGDPDLAALFAATEPATLPPALAGSPTGRSFLAALDAYLDDFGWRNDVAELAQPTWREDPTIPLRTLKGYVALDEEAGPDRQFRRAVERREELLDRARCRLADDPAMLARFNTLNEQAAPYLRLSEDHNFYIDQMGIFVLRAPMLEVGRRLAERGVIADSGDVFMLTRLEIRAAMAGLDQRALVKERCSELARWAAIVPPASIGEPPAVEGPPDPLGEALAKLFGGAAEPSREPHILTGIGASPGVVRAPVKVVRHLDEADKLEPGDILVCDMTMPAWTPLFSLVSAVVANTGGMLSHCAIVAREYGLPCVVNTRSGTTMLHDGMVVTVDGGKGIIRIESGGRA